MVKAGKEQGERTTCAGARGTHCAISGRSPKIRANRFHRALLQLRQGVPAHWQRMKACTAQSLIDDYDLRLARTRDIAQKVVTVVFLYQGLYRDPNPRLLSTTRCRGIVEVLMYVTLGLDSQMLPDFYCWFVINERAHDGGTLPISPTSVRAGFK